MFGALGSD